MTKATIKFWKDGDSGEFESGERFRLAKAQMPERNEPQYQTAKRNAQHLAPEGSEVDIRVVGRDQYGRKLVIMRSSSKNVNANQMRRFQPSE